MEAVGQIPRLRSFSLLPPSSTISVRVGLPSNPTHIMSKSVHANHVGSKTTNRSPQFSLVGFKLNPVPRAIT